MTSTRLRPLSSLGLFTLLAASHAACSSSAATTSTDSGAPDSGTDAHVSKTDARGDAKGGTDTGPGHDAAPLDAGGPTEAGKAPPMPGAATTATTGINFAVHHFWLGDTAPLPTFPADTTGTAWSTFGYNIDGLITNANSTDVCTLRPEAPIRNQIDGVNGIDNSFGENIVGILEAEAKGLSKSVTTSIESGSFTILLNTVGLTSSTTQTNTGLSGALFEGANYGSAPPAEDGGPFLLTDDWPVSASSLVDGGLEAGSRLSFPKAYVTNGTWVNGSPVDITLAFTLKSQPFVLSIHQAIITFNHTVDSAGQDHATGGIISGVLKTAEFLAEISEVAAD